MRSPPRPVPPLKSPSSAPGVTSEAPTATEALHQNSTEMQKVIARIKALGVADKDIQTTGINLNAMYDYDQEARRVSDRSFTAGSMGAR